jgi:mRNA interferase MazF
MRRGEIWSVNLDPTIGSEIRKQRPALIVNRDAIGVLPLKIVVPITGWREAFGNAPWFVSLDRDPANGIVKKSAADAFQVRSVSEQRLVEKLGDVDAETMKRVETALALVLNLDQ